MNNEIFENENFVQDIPDIDAEYEAWYTAQPAAAFYSAIPQADEEAAYDDILAEAETIRSTDDVPMSLDDFDTELTLFFAPVLKVDGWLDAWHRMVNMGYGPGTILNAAELIARMCYTEQSVAADFELLKDKVPPILCAVYTAVNSRLIVNAAGFQRRICMLYARVSKRAMNSCRIKALIRPGYSRISLHSFFLMPNFLVSLSVAMRAIPAPTMGGQSSKVT